MRKFFVLLSAVLLMTGAQAVDAQSQQGNKPAKPHLTAEQIHQRQCNQMVRTLMLDDATTAKFTPLYMKYLSDLKACRMAYRHAKPSKAERQAGGGMGATMTDAAAEKTIKDHFAQSRKILDLRENYYTQFRKILSPKQILKMYQTERSNVGKLHSEYKMRAKRQGMKGDKKR
jgi:hypothetical protein